MFLVVDTRERKLIEKLTAYLSKNHAKLASSVQLSVQTLALGDILFQKAGDSSPTLVIERKTVSDLRASIADGRAREQKYRLKTNYPLERLMILVEGSLDKDLSAQVDGIPVDTLIGSMINTQLRDGFHLYKTNSMDETVCFLVKLAKKLDADQNEFFNYTDLFKTGSAPVISSGEASSDLQDSAIEASSEYVNSLKKTKKGNMTPLVCYQVQLCTIPGVTTDIAAAIIGKYPSLAELTEVYAKIPPDLRDSLLKEISFHSKTGHTRNIGPAVSTRVHRYFYGLEIDQPTKTQSKTQSKNSTDKNPCDSTETSVDLTVDDTEIILDTPKKEFFECPILSPLGSFSKLDVKSEDKSGSKRSYRSKTPKEKSLLLERRVKD